MPVTDSEITEVGYRIEVLENNQFTSWNSRVRDRSNFETHQQAMQEYEKLCEEYPESIFRVLEIEVVTTTREVTSSRD